MTDTLIAEFDQTKNNLFKQLHKKFDTNVFERYKKQRNTLNREIKRAKANYYKDLIDHSSGNSKTLWKIISELANLKKNKNKKTFPNEIVTDNAVIEEPQKICEAFNIGKNIKLNESTHSLLPNLRNSFFFSPATREEIYTLIGDIKMKKTVKENDFDDKFLKLSNAVIAPCLCDIFNSCIQQGTFPNFSKIAVVVPVFKKGNSNLLTNFRPISILSQISKIFEKMSFNKINDYLQKCHLISDKQFGFRQNSFTFYAISNI